MDPLNIVNSTLMSGIVRKIITRLIKKKLGIDANVVVSDFSMSMDDEKAMIDINAHVTMSTDDVIKLISF